MTYYGANPIALAFGKKLLFAANRGDNTITAFTLNSRTGELTAVGTPVANGGLMGIGGSLAVDDDENFLFVGNGSTPDISVFAIAADGGLTPVPGSPFPIGSDVDGMTMNLVGTTLYVAAPTANVLIVLNVAADGTLTPIPGSPFSYTVGGNIASFVLASSTLGLSAEFNGGTIASYSIDAMGAPTFVESLAVGSESQCVTTARNGSLAFASGGGNGSISVIQVAVNGTLTPVVGSPFATSAATSGYAVAHPRGKFLYATEVSQIEALGIDAAGALTSIGTYPLTNFGYATGAVIY